MPPRKKRKLTTSKGSEENPTYSYWLMKSEPESRFENGIDVKGCGCRNLKDLEGKPTYGSRAHDILHLQKETDQTACWDGVRNYQARNFMQQMKTQQLAFFYHSNCKVPGIAGVIKIVKEAYVDHTQFDRKDPHFDSASKKDCPKWFMVDVKFQRVLKRFISLAELKHYHLEHKASGGPLAGVALFTKARLSVQPLTEAEWDFILSLESAEPL